MSANQFEANADLAPSVTSGWRELWLKEDWWAIWLGLGIVVVGYVLFVNGASLKWIAVTPEKWELCLNLGDGVNQAANLASGTTSIPSRNLAPLTIFGNWF